MLPNHARRFSRQTSWGRLPLPLLVAANPATCSHEPKIFEKMIALPRPATYHVVAAGFVYQIQAGMHRTGSQNCLLNCGILARVQCKFGGRRVESFGCRF